MERIGIKETQVIKKNNNSTTLVQNCDKTQHVALKGFDVLFFLPPARQCLEDNIL